MAPATLRALPGGVFYSTAEAALQTLACQAQTRLPPGMQDQQNNRPPTRAAPLQRLHTASHAPPNWELFRRSCQVPSPVPNLGTCRVLEDCMI